MRITIAASLAVLVLLVGSLARAGDTNDPKIPNLVGTWVSFKAKCQHLKGITNLKAETRITEQNGVFFKGKHVWEHADKSEAGMHDGKKHTTHAEELFLGVIAHDGKSAYIVEKGDTGYFHLLLIDPDTMHSLYLESGLAPTVCHEVWKRKK